MQDFRKKIVRPVVFCAILLCLLMAASAVMSALARTNTDLVQNRNKSMVELENDNTVEKAARRIVDSFVNEASVVKYLWI